MSSKNPFTTLVDETFSALEQAQGASLRLTQAALAQLPAQVEASFDVTRDVLEQQRGYAVRLARLVADSRNAAAA
jgi:hypothetical protein